MKRTVRVGSRESRLAMAQTELVIKGIKEKNPDIEFEIVGIKTTGDLRLDQRLDKIGGKGLFIKELENALLEGEIDVAVHSMKDMPAKLHEGLKIAAVTKREDPRDVIITYDGRKISELKAGAVIGTSSIRREVQLLGKRPDLNFKLLRGNVLTRIDKLLKNEYDAVILAAAGLKRLGLSEKITEYLSVEEMIPAVCQGIIGIETRVDEDIDFLLNSIHDNEASICAEAERAFMIKLDGGCTTPMAAFAQIDGDTLAISGMLAGEDRKIIGKGTVSGNIKDAAKLGEELAELASKK